MFFYENIQFDYDHKDTSKSLVRYICLYVYPIVEKYFLKYAFITQVHSYRKNNHN